MRYKAPDYKTTFQSGGLLHDSRWDIMGLKYPYNDVDRPSHLLSQLNGNTYMKTKVGLFRSEMSQTGYQTHKKTKMAPNNDKKNKSVKVESSTSIKSVDDWV